MSKSVPSSPSKTSTSVNDGSGSSVVKLGRRSLHSSPVPSPAFSPNVSHKMSKITLKEQFELNSPPVSTRILQKCGDSAVHASSGAKRKVSQSGLTDRKRARGLDSSPIAFDNDLSAAKVTKRYKTPTGKQERLSSSRSTNDLASPGSVASPLPSVLTALTMSSPSSSFSRGGVSSTVCSASTPTASSFSTCHSSDSPATTNLHSDSIEKTDMKNEVRRLNLKRKLSSQEVCELSPANSSSTVDQQDTELLDAQIVEVNVREPNPNVPLFRKRQKTNRMDTRLFTRTEQATSSSTSLLQPVDIEFLQKQKTKRRKTDPARTLSFKFIAGYLDFADVIPEGFYDAGRGTDPSFTLNHMREAEPMPDTREVLLIDTSSDARLRQLLKTIQEMIKNIDDDAIRVKLCAMFVSDSMGGRQEAFTNMATPFHRTDDDDDFSYRYPAHQAGLGALIEQCRLDVNHWKQRLHSNVIPLGYISHGLCRHRALLFKYLCDHVSPRIPCALIRGYREHGVPHAWNMVQISIKTDPDSTKSSGSNDHSQSSTTKASSPSINKMRSSILKNSQSFIIDPLDGPHEMRPTRVEMAALGPQYYPQYLKSSHYHIGDVHCAILGPQIGAGTFSRVYECHVGATKCAVKISPTNNLDFDEFACLLQEAAMLPWLNHPNIIKFLAYIVTETELRLFMELMPGNSLDHLIQHFRNNGRMMSGPNIVSIATGIARGLNFLHENKVTHRDLKSGNVLIAKQFQISHSSSSLRNVTDTKTSDAHSGQLSGREFVTVKRKLTAKLPSKEGKSGSGQIKSPTDPQSIDPFNLFLSCNDVKLCDFNTSVLQAASRSGEELVLQENSAIGTIRWMSPEILKSSYPEAIPPIAQDSESRHDHDKLTNKADVWSFGVILYELLTLRLPYEDLTEHDILGRIIYGRAPDLPQVADSSSSGYTESKKKPVSCGDDSYKDTEKKTEEKTDDSLPSVFKALISIYKQCTACRPTDRPTMEDVLEHLSRISLKLEEAQTSSPSSTSSTPNSFLNPYLAPSTPHPNAESIISNNSNNANPFL